MASGFNFVSSLSLIVSGTAGEVLLVGERGVVRIGGLDPVIPGPHFGYGGVNGG